MLSDSSAERRPQKSARIASSARSVSARCDSGDSLALGGSSSSVRMNSSGSGLVLGGRDSPAEAGPIAALARSSSARSDSGDALALGGSSSEAASACVLGDSESNDDSDVDGVVLEASSSSGDSAISIARPTPEASPARHGVFAWAFVALRTIKSALGSRLQDSLLAAPQTYSTHFSGVRTVEVAVAFLLAAAPTSLGFPLRWRTVAACEVQKSCAKLLLQCRLPASCCVFKDILDVCRDREEGGDGSVRVRRQDPHTDAFDTLKRSIFKCGGPVQRRCWRHGGYCDDVMVQGDISGSPCTPWSRAGTRLGRRHGLIALLIAWCHWLRTSSAQWAIHENVVGFDGDVLTELLSDMYQIVAVKVSPNDLGYSIVRRKRIYHILYLRGHVEEAFSMQGMYDKVCEAAQAELTCPPLNAFFFGAGAADLCVEENRARKRRRLSPVKNASGDWTYLLTAKQRSYLQEYVRLWQVKRGSLPEDDPDCVFDLGQNPAKRPSYSLRGALPTLRHTKSTMWSPGRKRWLVARELAAVCGYPVTVATAAEAQVPLDAAAALYTQPMLGNAMHVSNVGTVMSVALACLRVAKRGKQPSRHPPPSFPPPPSTSPSSPTHLLPTSCHPMANTSHLPTFYPL